MDSRASGTHQLFGSAVNVKVLHPKLRHFPKSHRPDVLTRRSQESHAVSHDGLLIWVFAGALALRRLHSRHRVVVIAVFRLDVRRLTTQIGCALHEFCVVVDSLLEATAARASITPVKVGMHGGTMGVRGGTASVQDGWRLLTMPGSIASRARNRAET